MHNVCGGTAHKVSVRAVDGEWRADFGTIPYLPEGGKTEVVPLKMVGPGGRGTFCEKFIDFIRMYDGEDSKAASEITRLPVMVSFENSHGVGFEQDFHLTFEKHKGNGGRGKAGMIKHGSLRILKSPRDPNAVPSPTRA